MLVKELMDSEPLVVETSVSLRVAIPEMTETTHSCLIVVSDNCPVGIITERDVTKLFSQVVDVPAFSESPVSEVMTLKPVCISEDSIFRDALMLSRSRKLRHLPVVNDQNELVGVVTQTNLVDAYVKLIDKHTELENNLEELKLLSLEDPLLGIGNRRAMEVDLSHTQAEAKRHNKTYGVALLDIDFFKKYNDRYGHQAGDEVLRMVAKTIKQLLRDSDRVFRYGGEELLILMPETCAENAKICSERVRVGIEGLRVPNQDSPLEVLTASIGLTAACEANWEDLLEIADQALYQAKNQGRNKVILA